MGKEGPLSNFCKETCTILDNEKSSAAAFFDAVTSSLLILSWGAVAY